MSRCSAPAPGVLARIAVAVALIAWPAAMAAQPDRAAAGAETPVFTIAAFLEVPVLGAPAVSPDGKQVAYLWSRRDLGEDGRLVQLWLADVESGETRRLTFTDDAVRAVAWRPGGGVSYLRAAGDHQQVWWNPLDGAEPRPLTDLGGGVSAYWWSPEGRRLAVLAAPDAADLADRAGESQPEQTEEAAADTGAGDDDRADWTVWDRLEQPDEFEQLWIVAVGDAGPDTAVAPSRITDPPLHPYHAAWHPDGQLLAVTYNERFSSLVDEEQRVALVAADGDGFTPLTPADRHSSLAAFSPDGSRLAYYTDRRAELRAYLNLKDVVVRDLASGDAEVVTVGSQLTLGGSGSTPAEPPIWSQNSRHLYLRAAEGTALDLHGIDVRRGTLERITAVEGNVGDWDLAGGTLAYIVSALHQPGSLVARPVRRERSRVLASTNDAVTEFGLRPPRKLVLPGHDGGTVEGFLFLPRGAGEGDRLPAIIEMHGGPYSRYGDAWTTRYPWHVLADAGFAVFIANPRGGTGYGEEFLTGVYRNFGTDDYLDLMAAVDELVARDVVDPERLGFTGYSYGGLMTNSVISRTDRFRAAVSIAGIFNYVSAMGQSNPQLFIDSYQRPWDEDLQRMWEHSPASRAANITTPTLIMHGTEDEPVDPRQSIELFSYLQLNGVPSRLVLYPGEGHGINEPSHMLDYQTRELAWFRHHVLGDESADGGQAAEPVEPPRR
ncbi:MAG: S9 family peptidase [Candidatus Krumholzibacteriia bacterium]